MKHLLILIAILSLFSIIKVQGQNSDLERKIKEQLGAQDKKKMAEAEKYQLACNNDKAEAEKLEGSSKKKVLQKQISASENQGIANNKAYKIYCSDLEKFDLKKHDSAKVIDKKMVRAKKIMKLSRANREAALKLTKDQDVYNMLDDADELEYKAFRDIFFVYALLLGENSKQKEIVSKNDIKDVVIEENLPDKSKKPVNEEKIPKSNNAPNSQEETRTNVDANKNRKANNTEIGDQQNIKKSEINIEASDEKIDESDINSNVYFKIQIAASKTQLSVDQLVRNFPTKEVLNVEVEGDWYKYSIRKKFTDYNEAIDYRANLKIKGAFIIAFKNGKKVTIEEALKKDIVENKETKITENKQIDNVKPETGLKTTYRLQ